MSQLEWQQVKEIFYQALSSPLESRREFLDSACGGDQSLRSQVEVLLDSYDSGFLENSLYYGLSQPSGPLLEPGRTFSHYTILKRLGRGGMGEVYLANDTALDRLTAIKVIHGESGFGDKAPLRLVREARAAAKLDHPNICSVYEVGEFEGQPFIAMQYIEGDMLDERIAAGAVTHDQAITFTRQIASALGKAHSWGIVHRDIKPSNIIIDINDQVKVLDFGLAKETQLNSSTNDLSAVGMIAGTVTYMSPEHLRGQDINGQTDIWSLGVVLYQMLTGRLPFMGETKADLIASILNSDFDAGGNGLQTLSPSVQYVLNRALQKDRSVRYSTVEEMSADLAKIQDGGSVDGPWSNIASAPFSLSTSGLSTASSSSILRFALPIALLLALIVGATSIWRFSANDTTRLSFASGSSGELQITNLYSLKRQSGGAITNLSFSPDGQNIVFSLSGNAKSYIYMQHLAAREPVRLTDGQSLDYMPVWSPDSQRVAYLSDRDGRTAILAVPASGGTPTLLADLNTTPMNFELRKWRNDGRSILFESSGGLKEIDLATGLVTDVDVRGVTGKPFRFTVSPDESKMLIAAREEGKAQLWVKSMDSPDATHLGEVSNDGLPSWFNDNRRFAFSSNESGGSQIYIRDLDGGSRQVTFGNFDSTQPVVSPDGKQIVYVSNFDEANLFSNEIATAKETAVTNNVNLQLFPSFSADGRFFAYQTIRDSTKLWNGTLRLAPYPDGPITTLDNDGCCAQWLKDGLEIAFIRQTGIEINIFRGVSGRPAAPVTTVGVQKPTNTIAPFDFHHRVYELSPDRSHVAFISRKSGQDNVWTAAVDGSDEKNITNLTDGTTRAFSPRWSPDGESIAYLEALGKTNPSSSTHVRVSVYAQAGISSTAEFRSQTTLLGWSALKNGVYVSVKNGSDLDIYFVAFDGSGRVEKINMLANARRMGINISPDQRWIQYTERLNDIDNLCIIPLEGGQTQRVTANTDTTFFYSGVIWSPDSKSLLYSKQTGGMQISLISTNYKTED